MENTKKILSALFLSLFICLGITNCKDPNQRPPEDGPNDQQPDDDPGQDSIYRPNEVIEITEAKKFYDTYEDRRVQLIQDYEDSLDGDSDDPVIQQEQKNRVEKKYPNDPNGEKFDVARYVYWDYKTIKAYLRYIEKEAKAADIEISTLRFYFSNNPVEDSTAVHPRQNSIMISPTLKWKGREYIFSIDDSDAENPRPILLTEGFGPSKETIGMGGQEGKTRSYASFAPNTANSNLFISPFYPGNSVTMNRGTSVPPPYHHE